MFLEKEQILAESFLETKYNFKNSKVLNILLIYVKLQLLAVFFYSFILNKSSTIACANMHSFELVWHRNMYNISNDS